MIPPRVRLEMARLSDDFRPQFMLALFPDNLEKPFVEFYLDAMVAADKAMEYVDLTNEQKDYAAARLLAGKTYSQIVNLRGTWIEGIAYFKALGM